MLRLGRLGSWFFFFFLLVFFTTTTSSSSSMESISSSSELMVWLFGVCWCGARSSFYVLGGCVCVFMMEQRCRCHHGGFPYKSTANKKLRTKSPCFSPRQNSGTLQQHVLPKSKGVHLIAPFCTRPGVLL